MNGNATITVLLVEDEILLAAAQKSRLEKRNFSVLIAGSGEEAIECLKANFSVDLVLMDIDLGNGMNGIETAKTLLENHDVPILFLTSHAEADFFSSIEDIPYYGYVIKDLNIGVLDASIKIALRIFESHQSATAEALFYRNNLETVYSLLTHPASTLDDIAGKVLAMLHAGAK